ncbi:DUF4255 domain-containing protein [Bradyrhizobium sp. McL0616]|uniref:DUF4255 domain-containing protein n=1 Tax=Bradyrhizobium sp. McL0616 TaxID=3415674 RepID=UPI003CFA08C8
MSNALAIAAVTETLVQLLQDNIGASGVTGARVTGLAPDGTAPMPNPGVNVFLYQVTPNAAYRNADLPTRGPDGSLKKRPQIALDLHYLFTFYGDDSALEQQRMLASVALTLHAKATLPRSLITSVQAATPFLHASNLDTQAELIRFTPIVYTLEELSKLWSFLLKIDYVLSTAYAASVVLIETDDAVPSPALPVLSFDVTAQPFALPVIKSIVSAADPADPITDGTTIVLAGANLAATAPATSQVRVSGVILTPSTASQDSLTVALPAGDFPAGIQAAQIVQSLSLGSPPVPHPGTGVISGVASFVLAPTITPGSISAGAGPVISFTVTPRVQAKQRVVLQLTSQATSATHLFDGGALAAANSNISVPTPGLGPGTYFVRVLIDGALSPLTPPTGTPTGPLVTV